MTKRPLAGLIFDLQGHSIHDGPGSRTTVFLSGCPLRCAWCSNPEGILGQPVVLHRRSRCAACGRCLARCPRGAIASSETGLAIDRRQCARCSTRPCLEACLHEALVLSGRRVTVADLLRRFERDRPYWGKNGGVTLSGGEPLRQRRFVMALAEACREAGIHVCLETSAHTPPATWLETVAHLDWVFVDLKHLDSGRHRELTGVGNRWILANLRALAASAWPGFMAVRLPLVPGCNDSAENLQATARFVRELGLEMIHVLPFHRLGESKYRQMGRDYACAGVTPPDEAALERAREIIQAAGLICFLGADTPF